MIKKNLKRYSDFLNESLVAKPKLTKQELDTIITRMGEKGKIIFSGDYRQSDLEKAREVIQRSLDVMPEYNVPYEQPQIMWQLVDLMYQAEFDEKALELSKRMIDINNQEIDFYHSLDEKHQKSLVKDITMRVQINDRLSTMALMNAPDNADFKALDEVVRTQMEEFQLPAYKEYLEQEKKMEEMKRTQDSLIKVNNAKRTTSVSLEGPSGIIKK